MRPLRLRASLLGPYSVSTLTTLRSAGEREVAILAQRLADKLKITPGQIQASPHPYFIHSRARAHACTHMLARARRAVRHGRTLGWAIFSGYLRPQQALTDGYSSKQARGHQLSRVTPLMTESTAAGVPTCKCARRATNDIRTLRSDGASHAMPASRAC